MAHVGILVTKATTSAGDEKRLCAAALMIRETNIISTARMRHTASLKACWETHPKAASVRFLISTAWRNKT